jgi:hypothetical protein
MAIRRLFSDAGGKVLDGSVICTAAVGASFTGGVANKALIVRCTEFGAGLGGAACFFVNFQVRETRANRLISKAFSKISLDLGAATH